MDFLIEDFGSEVRILRPMSEQAVVWSAVNLPDFPKFAGGLVIQPRYNGYVRRALPAAGFALCETTFGRKAR